MAMGEAGAGAVKGSEGAAAGWAVTAGCTGSGGETILGTGKASADSLGASKGVTSSGVSAAGATACGETRRASITGPSKPTAAGGATCTSAITAACKPNEIHTAANGRCTRGGIVGSSKGSFTDTDTHQGIDAPVHSHTLQDIDAPMHSHVLQGIYALMHIYMHQGTF
jgi:hypothetical protein